MTVPLMVLAFGSLVVGAYFAWTHGFSNFLAATPSLACFSSFNNTLTPAEHGHLGLTSTILTFFGIAVTATLYLGGRKTVERLTRFMDIFGLYTLSYGKFFIDSIYATFVVLPLLGVARLAAWFDSTIIDGLVDSIGSAPKRFGATLRPLQNGLVQFYALAMMLGLLILMGALLM
jgi:NADH-quinone oxidoreductase subunit L